MKHIYINTISLIGLLFFLNFISCNKETLLLQNFNQPSSSLADQEAVLFGIAAGVYDKAFGVKDYFGSGGSFSYTILAAHEMMGDNIFCPYGNYGFRWSCGPKEYTFDGKTIKNPLSAPDNVQPSAQRARNNIGAGDANLLLYEWTMMYGLNSVSNEILRNNEFAKYSSNVAETKAIISAWAHWWKGFAYSRLGSIYTAGIIIDDSTSGAKSNKYVSSISLQNKADEHFNIALNFINAVSNTSTFETIIAKLIPSDLPQVDKASFIANIFSFKARNILVNKKKKDMIPADWALVNTYASKGLKKDSKIFVIKTNSDKNKSLIPQGYGTIASNTVNCITDAIFYFTSPRFIQNFDTSNDSRYKNNFKYSSKPVANIRKRGLNFGTSWEMILGGTKSVNGAFVYAKEEAGVWGEDEDYIGCSYEETELMLAEAAGNTGNLAGAIIHIDNVKTNQNSGLPTTVVVDVVSLNEEILKERKRSLLFRGLAFYDARRYEITQDGKGLKNAWLIDADSKLHTDVTINYAFLDYWDVPNNELDTNPASGDSVTVISTQ